MTTPPDDRATTPHRLVPGAYPHASAARRFEVRRRDGSTTTYISVVDLARAWALDYPSLRNFVRDHAALHSEKQTFPDPDRPGQDAVLIVIEIDALGVLYEAVRTALALAPRSPG